MARIQFGAVAISLTFAVAACTGVADPSPSDAAPISPPPSTSAATTPTVASSPSAPGPSAPAIDRVTAIQDVLEATELTLGQGTLRFEVKATGGGIPEGIEVTGRGQVSFEEPRQFRFLSDAMGDRVPLSEVIVDDHLIYSRGRHSSWAPEDTWIVFELDEKPFRGTWPAFVRQYGEYTLMLLPLLGTVESTAGETDSIGGVGARRYAIRIDVDAARTRVPEHLREGYDLGLEQSELTGIEPQTRFDAWIDDAGRIVRMGYVVEAESLTAPITVTFDFDDFGAAMDVRPPDGAEVLSVDEARERYQQTSATPTPSP